MKGERVKIVSSADSPSPRDRLPTGTDSPTQAKDCKFSSSAHVRYFSTNKRRANTETHTHTICGLAKRDVVIGTPQTIRGLTNRVVVVAVPRTISSSLTKRGG